MKKFIAQAHIALADRENVLAQLYAHMSEHSAELEILADSEILHFSEAHALFSRDGDGTIIDVTAQSLEAIYFARMALTAHILEFSDHHVPDIVWHGDGNDITRPPNFQLLEVVACHSVTPHMRRVTFRSDDVSRFAPMDALHLNIMVQHPGRNTPQWPLVGANGLIHWEDPLTRPILRKYTVRTVNCDAGLMDIDFVLHEDAGPGAVFAMQVKIGDQVGIMGPGGGGLKNADWYLFAGDETALPAISRMLESLPVKARGIALIEVADEREIQPLATCSGIEIRWLVRQGKMSGTTQDLADAVEQVQFPDDGSRIYVWAGCEFEAFRRIRGFLRHDRGLEKNQHLVVSYWRRGNSED